LPESGETIRVLIAAGHHLIRAGIHAVLDKEPDIEVVGEAQDTASVRDLVAQLCPDVVLLDLDMPGLRPSQIDVWIRTNCPEPATLIVTTCDHTVTWRERLREARWAISPSTRRPDSS
jgi:two-component system nitrate/nitrite response regulator NarL